MKKTFIISITTLILGSVLFSGTIKPQISLRYNDLVNSNNELSSLETTLVLGFAMEVGEGVHAGYDSDTNDSRIFISFDYGTMGLGMDSNGDPQFTIGAKYNTLSNLAVSLDYVINNLAREYVDDEPVEGSIIPNELRMSLGVTF